QGQFGVHVCKFRVNVLIVWSGEGGRCATWCSIFWVAMWLIIIRVADLSLTTVFIFFTRLFADLLTPIIKGDLA
ncbi:MAG: hypothetical protein AAGJ35_12015, partial [Myxococcota bacterium]